VIRTFRHRGLKRLFEAGDRKGIGADIADKVERILANLDVSISPEGMSLPGYRLHALKGDRKGFWSVTVNANWRIVFRFEGQDAFDVDLVDYH
jgi:proteic killer suppression protein